MATTAAPYGFWATNTTKKLAHCVYLMGQPLSRNIVFQNFSGESNGVKIKAISLLANILVFGPIFAPRVKLCAWTQNHPKKVGTCPGLPLQPVSYN